MREIGAIRTTSLSQADSKVVDSEEAVESTQRRKMKVETCSSVFEAASWFARQLARSVELRHLVLRPRRQRCLPLSQHDTPAHQPVSQDLGQCRRLHCELYACRPVDVVLWITIHARVDKDCQDSLRLGFVYRTDSINHSIFVTVSIGSVGERASLHGANAVRGVRSSALTKHNLTVSVSECCRRFQRHVFPLVTRVSPYTSTAPHTSAGHAMHSTSHSQCSTVQHLVAMSNGVFPPSHKAFHRVIRVPHALRLPVEPLDVVVGTRLAPGGARTSRAACRRATSGASWRSCLSTTRSSVVALSSTACDTHAVWPHLVPDTSAPYSIRPTHASACPETIAFVDPSEPTLVSARHTRHTRQQMTHAIPNKPQEASPSHRIVSSHGAPATDAHQVRRHPMIALDGFSRHRSIRMMEPSHPDNTHSHFVGETCRKEGHMLLQARMERMTESDGTRRRRMREA